MDATLERRLVDIRFQEKWNEIHGMPYSHMTLTSTFRGGAQSYRFDVPRRRALISRNEDLILSAGDAYELVDLIKVAGSYKDSDIREYSYKVLCIFDAILHAVTRTPPEYNPIGISDRLVLLRVLIEHADVVVLEHLSKKVLSDHIWSDFLLMVTGLGPSISGSKFCVVKGFQIYEDFFDYNGSIRAERKSLNSIFTGEFNPTTPWAGFNPITHQAYELENTEFLIAFRKLLSDRVVDYMFYLYVLKEYPFETGSGARAAPDQRIIDNIVFFLENGANIEGQLRRETAVAKSVAGSFDEFSIPHSEEEWKQPERESSVLEHTFQQASFTHDESYSSVKFLKDLLIAMKRAADRGSYDFTFPCHTWADLHTLMVRIDRTKHKDYYDIFPMLTEMLLEAEVPIGESAIDESDLSLLGAKSDKYLNEVIQAYFMRPDISTVHYDQSISAVVKMLVQHRSKEQLNELLPPEYNCVDDLEHEFQIIFVAVVNAIRKRAMSFYDHVGCSTAWKIVKACVCNRVAQNVLDKSLELMRFVVAEISSVEETSFQRYIRSISSVEETHESGIGNGSRGSLLLSRALIWIANFKIDGDITTLHRDALQVFSDFRAGVAEILIDQTPAGANPNFVFVKNTIASQIIHMYPEEKHLHPEQIEQTNAVFAAIENVDVSLLKTLLASNRVDFELKLNVKLYLPQRVGPPSGERPYLTSDYESSTTLSLTPVTLHEYAESRASGSSIRPRSTSHDAACQRVASDLHSSMKKARRKLGFSSKNERVMFLIEDMIKQRQKCAKIVRKATERTQTAMDDCRETDTTPPQQ